MHIIFIADAHLKKKNDANYVKLLLFLKKIKGRYDKLFIMGDLFDFWIGYDYPVSPEYDDVIAALADVSSSGTQIVYFEGNHDFHLGKIFREVVKAEIHPSPLTAMEDGLKWYLCHGDQMDENDTGYKILRRILHSEAVRLMTRVVPAKAALTLADILDRKFGAKQSNASELKSRRVIMPFAKDRFRDGCDVLVTGHFHTPFIDKNGNKTIISLGDWITQYSYAEYSDGEFSLKKFTP